MKIVHFISHFPYPDQLANPALTDRYVCSGGEWAAYHLVEEQAKAGHDVSVVASSVTRRNVLEQREGFAVRRYGSWFKIGETLFAPGMFFRPVTDINKPDIVHVHHTTPPGGMAGLACNRTWKSPLVVTHHGFENPDSYGSWIRRAAVFLSAKYFVGRLFSAANRIIYISPAFIQQSRFLGKFISKSISIPHGIHLAEHHTDLPVEQARRELGLTPEGHYGLFVGTLIPPKGLGVLLRALPEVLEKYPDFHLLVLGRGPSEPEFRQQAADLGVSGNVQFVGFIGEARKKLLYYRASDVLLIPSFLNEMYCFVLYEGAAAGCCIVTSDLEVFKSVINDHVNGILTPAGNSAEMAKALGEVLEDRQLQHRLMRTAKSQIPIPSWENAARKTEQVYAALLKEEHERAKMNNSRI
jgi:glycosyltransferase involved in cell wall biosynthesis